MKGANILITKGNFILLEKSEFKNWLDNKKVTRLINHLQVHHTYLPNYSTRKNQDPFKCLEGMRSTHLANGWSATGQHLSVLETGQIAISIDRDLNTTPAGIKGHNTGGITVEIIGDFNKNGDTITGDQKESVIHLYACLANKFNIQIDTDHIVYHAWFTPEGVRLPDYSPSKSSKTCPGTAFWGDGNTISSAKKTFLPAIQAELNKINKKSEPVKVENMPMTTTEKKAFEDLVAIVNAQNETIKKLQDKDTMASIPVWAVDACVAAKNAKLVDTTANGSYDFYRLLTILHRKGIF